MEAAGSPCSLVKISYWLRRCWWRIRYCANLRPLATATVAIFLLLIFIFTFALYTGTGFLLDRRLSVKQYHQKKTKFTADSVQFISTMCNNLNTTSTSSKKFDDEETAATWIQRNREKLRRQLPIWRRVVLMITFLNPTFESLDILHFLYGRFFGQVAYCVSTKQLTQWNATRQRRHFADKYHWLFTYDGYSRSKDDRSYECWTRLHNRLVATNAYGSTIIKMNSNGSSSSLGVGGHGLIGVMSIMDDVLVNLWNFGVVHRGGGASSILAKIWSMTNGGLLVPQTDTYATPFFIGNLHPLDRGFDEIGDAKSIRPANSVTIRRFANATLCNRSFRYRTCAMQKPETASIWSHYARFFDAATQALSELKRSSIIRQKGNASLTSLLEQTALFESCWQFLHGHGLLAHGNASLSGVAADNVAAIVGEIPADFIYMPLSRLEDFSRLLAIFRRHSLHAEIAIPTAVACLVHSANKPIYNSNNKNNSLQELSTISSSFVPLADSGMLWNATTRLKPWRYYKPTKILPFLHPVKFAQFVHDGTLRAFLCERVFPNFIV